MTQTPIPTENSNCLSFKQQQKDAKTIRLRNAYGPTYDDQIVKIVSQLVWLINIFRGT